MAAVPFAALVGAVSATEMVYTPLIPAFGGNPNNGAGFAANATAQNNSKAPSPTALQQFNNSLQSAILSRLLNQSVTTLVGPGYTNLVVGSYDTLGYRINIEDFGQGQLKVTTTDKKTGESVEFIIAKNNIDTSTP